MLRNIFTAFFVSIILFQSGLLSLYTVNRILSHRHAMKLMMKSSLREGFHERDLVKFTEEHLVHAKWEHDREFFLGASKYDVIRTEMVNGKKIFVCVDDKKETELYKALDGRKNDQLPTVEHIRKIQYSDMMAYVLKILPETIHKHTQTSIEDGYFFNHTVMLLRPPIEV